MIFTVLPLILEELWWLVWNISISSSELLQSKVLLKPTYFTSRCCVIVQSTMGKSNGAINSWSCWTTSTSGILPNYLAVYSEMIDLHQRWLCQRISTNHIMMVDLIWSPDILSRDGIRTHGLEPPIRNAARPDIQLSIKKVSSCRLGFVRIYDVLCNVRNAYRLTS